jgi:hypothetical protein
LRRLRRLDEGREKKYINDHPSIFAAILIWLLDSLSLIFDHEDGSDLFLRNIDLSQSYMAL